MADLVHNRWYQSSSALGGYTTARFRAPVSHAITGDETHIARFENRELKKGINEVAEKCKKIAETLEEIRLKAKESQDRILDRLAQLQQRLSERFQISPKMAVEEQPPSLEEEEFTIDVYGGQDLEKKGVQVVELEPEKREEKESKSGKQNSNLKIVANLQNNIEGRRSRGGGDFADGFVGGGVTIVGGNNLSVAEVIGVREFGGGLSKIFSLMAIGITLEGTKEERLVRSRDGGDFSGGFVGGGPGGFAGVHGGCEGLMKMRTLEEGSWSCYSGSLVGVRCSGIAGTCSGVGLGEVVGGDWGDGESIASSVGESRDTGKKKSLKTSRIIKIFAEEAIKVISVNDQKDDISDDVKVSGSTLPDKSYPREFWLFPKLKPKFYSYAELEGDGPSYLYFNPISLHHASKKDGPAHLYSNLPPQFFNHFQHTSFFAIPLHIKIEFSIIKIHSHHSSFSLNSNNSSVLLGSNPEITKEYPISLHVKKTNSLPIVGQRLSSLSTTNLTSHVLQPHLFIPLYFIWNHYPTEYMPHAKPTTLEEIILIWLGNSRHEGASYSFMKRCSILIHLEDKVEVWVVGSDKHGGANKKVNGMAYARDSHGTPYNFEDGWHDRVPWRLLQYWSTCIETFAVWFSVPGINHSFLIFAVALERVRSLMVQTQNLVTFDDNLGDFCFTGDSRSILLNLEMEGAFIHEHFRPKFDRGSLENFCALVIAIDSNFCTLRAATMSLLILLLDSTQGFFLASSQNIKRRPTFNSDSLADYLISGMFSLSSIKVDFDYYPP